MLAAPSARASLSINDARATLHHARASIVASGTATVEAALIGNPFLVVYRVSPLSYAVARRVVDVPHVAMVNLIAGRRWFRSSSRVTLPRIMSSHTCSRLLEEGPRGLR